MAQRRFGPTLGAGTAVIEMDGQKQSEAAPLGVTVYATPLDRGPIGKLITTTGLRDLIRKTGNLIPNFDGPDCARDFWEHSQGAGELHLIRVATANIRAAALYVYSREMDVSIASLTGGRTRPVMKITAKNGGSWAGRKRVIWRRAANVGDVAAAALTTGLTMLLDEWAGGYIKLDGVPSKQYAITGNSAAGVVAVSSDSNMAADLAAGGDATNKGYQLILSNKVDASGVTRTMTAEFGDGEQNPSTEFSMNVYIDGTRAHRWPNLSMDPTSANYFVRIINDDLGNDDITVTDLLSPSNPGPSDRRPANYQSLISAISDTTLTTTLIQARNLSPATQPNPTFALGTTTATMCYRDVLRFEIAVADGNATITMKSMRIGGGTACHAAVTATNTSATAFAFTSPYSPLIPPITITCGTTVFDDGDVIEVDYMPFEPNSLVGGVLVPDLVNKPRARFNIISNTYNTITVQTGSLQTDGGGAVGDRFMVFCQTGLGGVDSSTAVALSGYDGLAGLSDSDYTSVALNPDVTPARKLLQMNKGLVKVACPDRNSTTVTKAGQALCNAFNWQYRVEIPDTVVTEDTAVAQINDTIGRDDFSVTTWPSYADVSDPERPGQLKRIPLTGAIHGREALIAKNYDGYQKAAAGTDVTLPRIVALPTADLVVNEEVTNPQGINLVKRYGGNYIIWGDRTISLDPNWKFKHKRELMSHYENRLRSSYDWVIFQLNDPANYALIMSSLRGMFAPEYRPKRALQGKTFNDACAIKIDTDNNTDATRANGDTYADITLWLADTIERFIIRVGSAGIFESTSS